MKIAILIPSTEQQPSQGRNPGSIPGGSATGDSGSENPSGAILLIGITLLPCQFYRARLEGAASPSEFVYLVGLSAQAEAAVFEDGAGDLHKFYFDEIELVQAG